MRQARRGPQRLSPVLAILTRPEVTIRTMISEAEQKQLNQDYAEYLVEAERLAAEGQAIGTFLAWAAKMGKNMIKVERRGGSRTAAASQ